MADDEDAPRPAGQAGRGRGWVRVPVRAVRALWVDRVLGMAAELAFWQIVSLPPLLLTLVGAVGYTNTLTGTNVLAEVQRRVLGATGVVFAPQVVHQILQPAILSAFAHGHAGTTVAGIVLSLWAGSTAMGDLMGTVTIAFGMRALRSPVRTRLLAVLYYIVQVLVGSVLLVLAAVGPAGLIALLRPAGPGVAGLVQLSYWPAVALVALAATTTLYHAVVPVRPPWWRQVPGAALALAMGGLGVFGLRAYLASAAAVASASAGIGAVIALLLFVYVIALALLTGTALNAEIDKQFPSEATRHTRRPHDDPERLAAAQRRGELAADWRTVQRLARAVAAKTHRRHRRR